VTLVLGLSAFKASFGLLVVFVGLFPALVQGIIAFALASAAGEHEENLEYLEKHSQNQL
jgi:hypothetical protein